MSYAVSSLLVAIVLGILFGIVTAVKRNTTVDYLGRVFSLAGLSFPEFYLGLLLMLLLAVSAASVSCSRPPSTDLEVVVKNQTGRQLTDLRINDGQNKVSLPPIASGGSQSVRLKVPEFDEGSAIVLYDGNYTMDQSTERMDQSIKGSTTAPHPAS